MSLAFEKEYAVLVTGVLQGKTGWLNRLTTDAEVSGLASNGSCGISYLSDPTATDITDGTITTNSFSSTTVNGTYVDKEVTLSLKPSEAGSMYARPAGLSKVIIKSADAFYRAQQNAAIAAIKAATPTTNCNITLTAGQMDFTFTSSAEAADNLAHIGQMIANCWANFDAADPEYFSLVFNPTSAANLMACMQTGVADTKYFSKTTVPGAYMGMSFMGIPMFAITGATNFGGASQQTCFMTTKDTVLLAREMPSLHGGGVIAAPDGTYKWITTGPFAYAALPFFGEIVNSTS